MFSWLLKTTAEGQETADEDATKTALSTDKNSNEKWVMNWSVFSAIQSSAICRKEEDLLTRNTCCEESKWSKAFQLHLEKACDGTVKCLF